MRSMNSYQAKERLISSSSLGTPYQKSFSRITLLALSLKISLFKQVFSGNLPQAADGTATNNAIFEALTLLKDEPNYRNIILTWTKNAPNRRSLKRHREVLIPEDGGVEAGNQDHGGRRPTPVHALFQNVMRQQDAIVFQLQQANVPQARRFADQLVRMQLSGDNGAEYASKSLCRLAQEAKGLGLNSLQLEWAKRATELTPHDTCAHGQTADAYIRDWKF